MKPLRGAFTALVTPMKSSGEIDYNGFGDLIKFQIAEGIDGILVLGTTGENTALNEEEENRLIEIAMKEASFAGGGKIHVMIGAGSNNTSHMHKNVLRAKEYGADSALVVTPYYVKPNDEGLIRHFETAGSVGIPIVIYNIPSRTGRNISASLMKKIAGIPYIAAVKEAAGDIVQAGDIIREIALARKENEEKFYVLSGDDALTLPLISLGGDGVISVISNLVPSKVKALAHAALEGDYEKARAIHYELVPLIKTAFIETNPVPIKQMLSRAGLPAGPVRLPLGKPAPETEAVLNRAMEGLGFRKQKNMLV